MQKTDGTPPTTSAAGTPKASLRVKLLACLFSLVICLVICEIAARLLCKDLWAAPRSAIAPPGIFSLRWKPNIDVTFAPADVGQMHVITNEDGLRGPTIREVSSKPLSIVSIGDSFTFGWGVDIEQHCMALFRDQYMRDRPGRDVGHAWVATGGWNPRDYYYAYKTLVQPRRADVLVIGFFAGNDILPAQTPRELDPARAADQPVLEPQRPLLVSVNWARMQFVNSIPVAKLSLKLGHVPDSFARFEDDIEKQRKYWDTTNFYLQAIVDQAKAQQTRVVMLSWPSLVQVEMPTSLDGAGLKHDMPDKVLEEFCTRNGVEFIPLLKHLQERSSEHDLFFRVDRHPTPKGHRVVAELLAQRLAPIIDDVWAAKSGERAPATAPLPPP